ncbi:hypothetical protein VTG60DRAFT_1473 [Thermothelomyces hinnuleus]
MGEGRGERAVPFPHLAAQSHNTALGPHISPHHRPQLPTFLSSRTVSHLRHLQFLSNHPPPWVNVMGKKKKNQRAINRTERRNRIHFFFHETKLPLATTPHGNPSATKLQNRNVPQGISCVNFLIFRFTPHPPPPPEDRYIHLPSGEIARQVFLGTQCYLRGQNPC